MLNLSIFILLWLINPLMNLRTSSALLNLPLISICIPTLIAGRLLVSFYRRFI